MTVVETPAGDAAPEPIVDPNAVSLTINGKAVTARKGDLIITAAEDNGDFIPRFCYHERMTPVGMCRMCLVEVDTHVPCFSRDDCQYRISCVEGRAGGCDRAAARQPSAGLPRL
jgi:2Fe-2S iron-sulfur cluster binding domain